MCSVVCGGGRECDLTGRGRCHPYQACGAGRRGGVAGSHRSLVSAADGLTVVSMHRCGLVAPDCVGSRSCSRSCTRQHASVCIDWTAAPQTCAHTLWAPLPVRYTYSVYIQDGPVAYPTYRNRVYASRETFTGGRQGAQCVMICTLRAQPVRALSVFRLRQRPVAATLTTPAVTTPVSHTQRPVRHHTLCVRVYAASDSQGCVCVENAAGAGATTTARIRPGSCGATCVRPTPSVRRPASPATPSLRRSAPSTAASLRIQRSVESQRCGWVPGKVGATTVRHT